MAGIGFQLRALANRGGLGDMAMAYVYGLFLVAGPWVFTVLTILGINLALKPSISWEETQVFRSVIIYNFCFTLILTGPVVLLSTRYLADQIYRRDARHIPFALFASLAAAGLLTLLVAAGFYLGPVHLDAPVEWLAILNFGLISAIWITGPFLSIIRDFRSISLAFLLGCVAALVLTVRWADQLDDAGVLAIFNAALALVLAAILVPVGRSYAGPVVIDRSLLRFIRLRWEIAAFGLFYYLGIWIDKIIMWHAGLKGSIRVGGVLATFPLYDSALFMAQLLAIPAFVFFFIHVETRFYEYYRRLYGSFEANASRRLVESRMNALGQFALAQLATCTGLLALLATLLLVALPALQVGFGSNALQAGIFQTGLIGTVFHTGFLLTLVFLLYFDLRGAAAALTALFFVLNGGLTIGLLSLGPAYFGAGYALASAICFATALLVLVRELPWLAYHAFITNNVSVGTEP